MTPTQRKAMEQALEALIEPLGFTGSKQIDAKLQAACRTLRAALEEDAESSFAKAEQPAEQEPFKPDWVNYRQGLADGWEEGYEQGVADERTSEANIGIAGFSAKVNPARENPYKNTAPQPAKRVPLTRDEIERIYTEETGSLIDTSPWALEDFVRAIEAAHGIKGETE